MLHQARVVVGFLLAFWIGAVVHANDSAATMPPEQALRDAERVALNVDRMYRNIHYEKARSKAAKEEVLRKSAELASQAANLYYGLSQIRLLSGAERQRATADQLSSDNWARQVYASRLVALGALLVGRERLGVPVVYKSQLADGENALWGVETVAGRGNAVIFISDKALLNHLHSNLIIATHEAIHQIDYANHMSTLPPNATQAEKDKHRQDWLDKRAPGKGRGAYEVETERRAQSAVRGAVEILDPLAQARSDEQIRQQLAEVMNEGKEPRNDFDSDYMFASTLRRSRLTLGWKDGDRVGNHTKALAGEPTFGGILLGNRCDAPRCLGMKIVQTRGRWQLVIDVETGGRTQTVVYDQFNLADLWSAYHIVRPSDQMKKAHQVWNQECGLAHCEDQTSGVRAGLHPALARSPMGQRCLALEVASGEVFLKDPAKKFGKDLKLALQWYDVPAKITAKDGKLAVVAADDPTRLLLRLRLVGTSDKFLENQSELPKDLADPRKLSVALIDILLAYKRDGRAWITAEQVDLELSKLALRSALKSHKNLKVDQKAAADAVMAATPDLVFVDRFARTLAVLNWAADHLKARFPAWPKEAMVAHSPVETQIGERRIADLCRLPHTPVESMDIPDRLREKGKEVWYALMNQGQHVGWAQGFVGPMKLGDGEIQTKRWLKVVLYTRRLNAEQVLVRENTVNTDKDGMMLRTKISIGTALASRLEIQASGGGKSLFLALFKEGKEMPPIRPATDWAREGVIYDSTFLGLSGRGFKLAKGQSERMKSINVEDIANAGSMPELTVTRLDDKTRTFRYKSVAGESVVTWDDDGFPTSIRQAGLDLELRQTTETAAQDLTNIRPFMASSLLLTAVEPPLPSVRGTVRWKIHTQAGAPRFSVEGDAEWKVVERPTDRSVVIENAMPLVHDQTGFRRLAAEDLAAAKKWLASGSLADSRNPAVQTFANRVCADANATTPLAKFAALQRAVSAHIKLDYGAPGLPKASAILKDPSGDCRHASILLTALLRAEGIPARIVAGLVVKAKEPAALGHAWVEGYADGHWHRVDAALYGTVYENVYLRQQTLDDAGDMSKLIKAVSQPTVQKIEGLSFVPTAKPASLVTKAKLTDEQQVLVSRLGFALGRAKLEALQKTLSPDGKLPTGWKSARSLASRLGVELQASFPTSEAHAFADQMNPVLALAEQSTGSERQSWETRFGSQAAASYALVADCFTCVHIRDVKALAELAPEARKQLEADLKAAKVPVGIQKDVLRLLLDEKLSETNVEKAMGLLSEHFYLKDAEVEMTPDVRKLLDALAIQVPRKK